MDGLNFDILRDALADSGEPVMLVRLDAADWPVTFTNRAFDLGGSAQTVGEPLGAVLDDLFGREMASSVADSIRQGAEASFPVQFAGREQLLVLKMLGNGNQKACGLYFRGGAAPVSKSTAESQHALLKAKRKIKDLSREDSATGLLNEAAFRDIVSHDWAVASREQSSLSILEFQVDDLDSYLRTFGRHAGNACLRRVGKTLKRSLRRASDLIAHPGDGRFLILSHATSDTGVSDFAEELAADIRNLGIHHPKSSKSKFVTVWHEVHNVNPADDGTADDFLARLLDVDESDCLKAG